MKIFLWLRVTTTRGIVLSYRVTASGELRTIGLSIRLERHTFSISVKKLFLLIQILGLIREI